jgi:hypothetical protein
LLETRNKPYTTTLPVIAEMKNKIFYILILIFLGACQTDSKIKESEKTESTTKVKSEPKKISEVNLTKSDLSNKTFEIGSSTHFTDTCGFYFECDCCSGDLIFSSDSTFYSIDYCMSDQSVSEGTYKISGNILTLKYSGICVSKVYNWENEMDTSAVDYFIKDTINKPHSIKFTAELCNNKLTLIHNGEQGKSIAIETKETFNNQIKALTENAIINRIDSLKNPEQQLKFINPKLTSIDGFPDEIDGCSCYFSKDSLDFKNRKYLYLDNYYSGTAFVKINNEIIKIDLEDKTKSDFEVEIIFETDEKTSPEVWWKTGKIKVIMPDGQILTESFVGECGC